MQSDKLLILPINQIRTDLISLFFLYVYTKNCAFKKYRNLN